MNAEMYKFYTENADFKNYVDKCVSTYGKDVNAVFDLAITKEYMRSLQKGGCNTRETTKNKNN